MSDNKPPSEPPVPASIYTPPHSPDAVHLERRVDPGQWNDQELPADAQAGFACPLAVPSQIASWIVILFCTGLMMVLVYMSSKIERSMASGQRPSSVDADVGGQITLGLEELTGSGSTDLLDGLDAGPLHHRVARIIVLAEMASREGLDAEERARQASEVRDELKSLERKIEEANYSPSEKERDLLDAVGRVVEARLSGAPLPETSDDARLIEEELGFAGKLAGSWGSADKNATASLRTKSAAKTVAAFAFFGIIGLALLAGLCAIAVMAYLLYSGSLASRFQAGSGWGTLHLEAFAIWMACFIVGQFLIGMLISALGVEASESNMVGLLLNLGLMYGPVFVALGWLFVRHPQPRLAFQEAGFTSRGFSGDLGKAFTTHLSFLPILGLAMILTIVLTIVFQAEAASSNPFAPPKSPSHPIQEKFDGSWSNTLLLFFLAAITAPLVEETVFRGLLYRYLRDATSGDRFWLPALKKCVPGYGGRSQLSDRERLWLSVGASTLVNGFIFASIHPQGLLGIPPLMTLAAAMSVAREWSGGLMAPMIIHAVNNGALVIFMSIMFS